MHRSGCRHATGKIFPVFRQCRELQHGTIRQKSAQRFRQLRRQDVITFFMRRLQRGVKRGKFGELFRQKGLHLQIKQLFAVAHRGEKGRRTLLLRQSDPGGMSGLGFGFLLYYLADLANSESLLALLVCQIIGGLVVYFAVQMLLQKSFKVFNRRGWLGAALLAVMLLVISAVVKFDLLGYERFVPEEDKVVSVDFSGSTMAEYIYTEDAERIEKITAIHRAILAQGEDNAWEWEWEEVL